MKKYSVDNCNFTLFGMTEEKDRIFHFLNNDFGIFFSSMLSQQKVPRICVSREKNWVQDIPDAPGSIMEQMIGNDDKQTALIKAYAPAKIELEETKIKDSGRISKFLNKIRKKRKKIMVYYS